MGSTITKLVFRPPKLTPLKEDKFFYIEIPPETSIFSCAQAEMTGCSIMPPNLSEGAQFSGLSAGNDSHRIPAFFLLRRGAKLTLLYSHGNAEDLGMMYRRMKDMARVLGVNVLAYDYSGYGMSQPRCEPSEKMCYRNIDAAYNYLIRVMKIPPSRIVLYGRSLGSGPSCYLAKRTSDEGRSVAGMILHSPFLSIYRIVLDVKSGFVGDMFQSYTRAKSIKCPVLMIHGENDQVVPFWHSDELLRSFQPQYRAKPFFVKGLGHNNIEVRQRKEYVIRVLNFFDNCLMDGGVVPEKERYKPNTILNASGKFLVNHTWIKHGREILRHALDTNNETSSNQDKMKQKQASKSKTAMSSLPPSPPPQKQQEQHQLPTNLTSDNPAALALSGTNELLAKFITDESDKNANETTESWDTDGTDVICGQTLLVPNTNLVNELQKMRGKLDPTEINTSITDRERNRDHPLDNLTNQL
jgi:pimeloyl-ACP methyl ester carboxylesterase